jgi:phospholipid-binding lipoprotein MlaA
MEIKRITNFKKTIITSLILLNACAANRYVKDPNDPLEPLNRGISRFNKTIDKLYIKPVSNTYELILPKALRELIHNFFTNIGEIPTTINNLLQAKYSQAIDSTARLVINSTLGIGGLFDVAAKANLKHKHEDFGKTLAVWGYKNSTYLVLPIFGPSTVRDGIGFVANTFLTAPYYFKPKWRNRYEIGYLIDFRSNLQETESFINNIGVDEYKSLKDIYLQHRAYTINDQNYHANNKTLLNEPPE